MSDLLSITCGFNATAPNPVLLSSAVYSEKLEFSYRKNVSVLLSMLAGTGFRGFFRTLYPALPKSSIPLPPLFFLWVARASMRQSMDGAIFFIRRLCRRFFVLGVITVSDVLILFRFCSRSMNNPSIKRAASSLEGYEKSLKLKILPQGV
ncbi:hypothetical protein BH11CYA1_BH11CYA1_45020 [soil metagenome]